MTIEIGTWVRRSNETRFLTLTHLVESVIADEPITRCGRRLRAIEGTTIRAAFVRRCAVCERPAT